MKLRHLLSFLPVFVRSLPHLSPRHLAIMAQILSREKAYKHQNALHLNTFFPRYPSVAFERFLQAVWSRSRVPYSTYLAVTSACPYACPHCSYANRPAQSMSTAQLLDTIQQIRDIGTITLGFTGGEPLLQDDLPQLIDHAVKRDMETIVFTTGYNLSASRTAALRDAGLRCLMIGLESHQSQIHDAIRHAPGSFTTARHAVEQSLNANLYTAISTIATREKIADGTLIAMAQMAQQWGVHEFRILEPVATGRQAHCTNVHLSADESAAVAQLHKQWNRSSAQLTIAAFSHLESPAMFGCGAGYHHLFIDAAGNVCPCDLTPMSWGNLTDQSLETIWQEMGKHFSRPRCQCVMKNASQLLQNVADISLPLTPPQSRNIMTQLPHDGKLPRIYQHYFK